MICALQPEGRRIESTGALVVVWPRYCAI